MDESLHPTYIVCNYIYLPWCQLIYVNYLVGKCNYSYLTSTKPFLLKFGHEWAITSHITLYVITYTCPGVSFFLLIKVCRIKMAFSLNSVRPSDVYSCKLTRSSAWSHLLIANDDWWLIRPLDTYFNEALHKVLICNLTEIHAKFSFIKYQPCHSGLMYLYVLKHDPFHLLIFWSVP